jgi:transcriptional regulator with XRE-family HTH domain
LASLRDALGMSQRELAAEFHVTGSAIAEWETGQKTIPGPVIHLMDLYERDLDGSAQASENSWFEKTTNAGVLVSSFMAQGLLASADATSIRGRLRDRAFAKYVSIASRNRGLTLKWTQLAWAFESLLSEKQRAALRSVESLGPMMTAAAAARVFAEEFGQPPRQAFVEWEPIPFASASLGQVHRAKLASGEDVAVKIQHPEAATRMNADLEQLRTLERVALVFLRHQTPGLVIEELRARFAEECDYRIEAAGQTRIGELFGDDERMHVPRVVGRWSSRRVLTTTFGEGQSLEAFARRATQAERDRAAETLWDHYWRSILKHGVFNTDPNPGNFLFTSDRVTFLDFGRVKHFSQRFHDHWRRFLRALLERNEDEAKASLVDIGYVKEPATFDFRPVLALSWMWTLPCLVSRPFDFTPSYLRRSLKLFAADTTRARVNAHPDMAFVPHVMFGLAGILCTLRASISCREAVLASVYPRGARRPPPFTDSELRKYGLLSSTGS